MPRDTDQGWIPPYGTRRRGPVPPGQMRVSDDERRAITDQLSEHYAAGRLDSEELNERMSVAMAAKTRSDLDGLLADLPPLESAAPPAVAPPRPARHLGPLRAVIFVCLALFILGGVHHFIWQMHLLFFFAAIAALAMLVGGRLFRRATGAWRRW